MQFRQRAERLRHHQRRVVGQHDPACPHAYRRRARRPHARSPRPWRRSRCPACCDARPARSGDSPASPHAGPDRDCCSAPPAWSNLRQRARDRERRVLPWPTYRRCRADALGWRAQGRVADSVTERKRHGSCGNRPQLLRRAAALCRRAVGQSRHAAGRSHHLPHQFPPPVRLRQSRRSSRLTRNSSRWSIASPSPIPQRASTRSSRPTPNARPTHGPPTASRSASTSPARRPTPTAPSASTSATASTRDADRPAPRRQHPATPRRPDRDVRLRRAAAGPRRRPSSAAHGSTTPKRYCRLFPAAYAASRTPLLGPRPIHGLSTWGQFLDFRGALKPAVAETFFKRNLDTLDVSQPWLSFPYQVLSTTAPFEAFGESTASDGDRLACTGRGASA